MKVKRANGRPKYKPDAKTEQQLEMMVAFGNTLEQCAQMLKVSVPTLRLYYRDSLDRGLQRANNAVAASLFKMATSDDPRSFQAKQFWLRCRAGWSEFSPPPPAPKPEPVGKKEQANIDAQVAHEGTDWGDLVRH